MIYNYTRCESVIAKIMADLDSTDIKLRTSDIKEWIFEAVDKIGAPMQYISRESGADGLPVLKIQDHQVPIPSDLLVLDGVAYSTNPDGPWVPMTVMSGTFKNLNKNPRKHHVAEYEGEKLITSQSQLYDNHNNKYWKRVLQNDLNGAVNKAEYFIKPGWIVTNKEEGYIKLAYKAIALDERGYPLIPDLASYLEAVYWYVTMKLTFSKYLKGTLGGNSKYAPKYASQIYYETQRNWNFYRNQAYAEAMMPTADDMKNIKREWNSLLPDYDADETFFKDINKEHSFYNDYYYGH